MDQGNSIQQWRLRNHFSLDKDTKKSGSPDCGESSTIGHKPRPLAQSASAALEPAATLTAAATASQSNWSERSTQSQSQSVNKILTSIGPKLQSWTNKNKEGKVAVRRVGPHVPTNVRYMFDRVNTISEVRTRVCRVTGMRMIGLWSERKKTDDTIITWNVRAKHPNPYWTWGRICFENETKGSTILLEGCKQPPMPSKGDRKMWPQVELDLSDLIECSVFPGQIVTVEGTNLTENLLRVRRMFTGSYLPLAKPPELVNDISIVVAAGPFTHSDDFKYQPLWELMEKIAEDEPHIAILIGPFLEYTHSKIESKEMDCTFQDFFFRLITKIKSYIDGKCTKIVLVSSSQDAHHHPVFPTPEYFLSKNLASPQIFTVSDPCYLDIEGFRIGITSTDCLMHIGREEVTIKQGGKDKLSRLGSYILNQACFYPLYPPAKEVNVDSQLWEKYAMLYEKPHMLLLPSNMRYFCKHIDDTIILNPERLSKRTFSRIYLHQSDQEFSTQKHVSCEVIKI